jgi:deazaflavin-dependent oxidoreductase (nitroreductase family)
MAEDKYSRPGWFTKNVFNRLVEVLGRIGISAAGAQTLAVRGRKSGEIRTNPVNPFVINGFTYLLSPRGTTQWARNLRVLGEGELRKGGKARPFTAEEVADADKLPLLRLYLDKWAWEAKGFLGVEKDASDEQLREIAPQHPAFRISFRD